MLYGYHVCYEGSCTVILEDTGPIRGYGLHHSYGARTPIRVTLLSCYEQATLGQKRYIGEPPGTPFFLLQLLV